MIITETLENGLIHTYSDNGMKIRQETGIVYDDAIDVPNSGHTYTETDIPMEEDISDAEALDILLGKEE